MSDFFKDFQNVSKTEWENKIISDLKGKDPSLLEINDKIEELSLSSYVHREDAINHEQLPGNYPYTRGMNQDDNDWNNGSLIEIRNANEANRKALSALNSGATLLIFKPTEEKTNWKVVLEGIQFEHIQTQFIVNNKAEYDHLKSSDLPKINEIQFNMDFHGQGWQAEDFNQIAKDFKDTQQRFCSVKGFMLQQCGANTWQEIAFSLSTGHEYLVRLMEIGFSIDEASACVSFNSGIGSNYFYEIGKLRALKQLWAKIVGAYKPEHGCSHNCSLTSVITHLNKSLSDPYTNLLRQTTEAMSSINGGANSLVVLPYDLHSISGTTELAERMALNISTILKEESFLDKVIDPLGGSYSIELITDTIGKKAWELFQRIDKNGGAFSKNVQEELMRAVESKRKLRIDLFNTKQATLIGVNKFENPDSSDNNWKEIESYLGMESLILELEHNNVTA